MGMKNTRQRKATDASTRTVSATADSLASRVWPRNAEDVVLGDYVDAPWVKSGRVFTRALRLHQQVSEPIPAGESAITSLAVGRNGKVYGATSGRRSHLFFYDPAPAGDGVYEIGVLDGVTDVRRCLVAVSDNIYVGASATTDAAGGAIYLHDTCPDSMDEFRAFKGAIRRLVVPVKGEAIAALCAAPGEQLLYGVSSRTGTFFEYDIKSGKVERLGQVSKDAAFSRTLVADAEGYVYGTHSLGTLFRYSPYTRTVEDTGIRIPTVAGRELYNQLDAAVCDERTCIIYGAGTADGVIFSFDTNTMQTRSIGKVIAEPRVRALTLGNDGHLYGIAGCEDGMGHLFRYDTTRSELLDLGIMLAASEVWRRGFEFDAACTGHDGTIYFGESERESHLFLYFPPTPALARMQAKFEKY